MMINLVEESQLILSSPVQIYLTTLPGNSFDTSRSNHVARNFIHRIEPKDNQVSPTSLNISFLTCLLKVHLHKTYRYALVRNPWSHLFGHKKSPSL
jgi:hypothetical protein